MKKYAYIENDKVILVNQDLPINWSNVSNFNLLPDNILKTYGWLPFIKESENKPIVVSSEFIIENDIVKEIITTREKTENEINQEREQELELLWEQVRLQRNNLLKDSDIFVVIDKWEVLSIIEKEKIRVYRQALRDLPQNFSNPEEIIWPIL
jgi:hypothetical protein